jgi:transposase
VSRLDPTLEPQGSGIRRIEVITGAGGRRRWSDEEKARAIEESLAPDAVVSQVARRHGATPQQLFTWRREARRKAEEGAEIASFVPAIMDAAVAPKCAPARKPSSETPPAPVMEIEVGGAHVWIWGNAEIGMATAILRALQTRARAK